MNETEFNLYWNLLCERHNRAPSAPLTRLYALTLKAEHLTAQEWGEAVAASLRFDDFFPSVQRLIDYTRPGLKGQALAEWDACLERARAGEAATLPGTYTRTLMNRVTNGRPLGEMAQDRLEWVKREFLERYVAHLIEEAKQQTPALAGPTQRALPHAAD